MFNCRVLISDAFLLCILGFGFSLRAPVAAASDTTFDVTGSFSDGVTLQTGSTILVDTTTGTILGADLVVPTIGATFTGTPISTLILNTYTWVQGTNTLTLGLIPVLGPPLGTNDLLNYTGGTANGVLTTLAPLYIGINLSGTFTLTDPPPVTPEPASALLFGSGLLMMVAFLRRRHLTPQA